MLTDGDGKSILAWTFAEDRQLTAGWTINSYELTVTNDSASGEIVDISGRKEYNAEITVTVKATCRGYTFLGWYEGENLLGTELSYTFSMPAKDVTYTAKWVENEEMAPFDFTSTPTTCVVTGVKDKTARSFVVPVYVTEIGEGAFSGCGSLESVTLPFAGGNASAVSASRSTLFGYIFGSASYEGGRQTSQVFGVNDTDVYTCYVPDSLRSVKITGGEILYGAFSGCTLLTEVIVPETIKTVADYAFYYCSNLKQFTIPVTVESIGDHAFYYCYDLKSITIPDRITRIGNYAFCYCSGLERVTLGKGIIGIEGSAFSACTRLTTINIPERVTSIGDYAFYVCDKLTSVYYESTEESWNTIEKGHSIFDSPAPAVYYYSASAPALNEAGTAYEGNYWRYDTDGVTPVIWKKEN